MSILTLRPLQHQDPDDLEKQMPLTYKTASSFQHIYLQTCLLRNHPPSPGQKGTSKMQISHPSSLSKVPLVTSGIKSRGWSYDSQ